MYIIAEVAQTHEGSVNQCIAFIDAIKKAGADAIKFQMHIAEAESNLDEAWRVKFSFQDKSRYDYWKRMEFSFDQWKIIRDYAKKQKIDFICSPFSEKAVEYLLKLDIDAWKIGSGEVLSYKMINMMIASKKTIYISSGMSSWSEMDEFVGYLKDKNANFTLMQCTTQYPTPLEKVGLNNLSLMQKRYSIPIGLSDHSGTIYPAIAAYFLGASSVELHVTLSKYMFGPDVSSSVDIDQLATLKNMIKTFDVLLENPVNKDIMSNQLTDLKNIFYKKAFAKHDISHLDTIKICDFEFKKTTCLGVSALFVEACVGKKLTRDLFKGELLTREHFSLTTLQKIEKSIMRKHLYYTKRAQQ